MNECPKGAFISETKGAHTFFFLFAAADFLLLFYLSCKYSAAARERERGEGERERERREGEREERERNTNGPTEMHSGGKIASCFCVFSASHFSFFLPKRKVLFLQFTHPQFLG